MNFVENALILANRGFHVFPLKINKKTPLHEGWQEEATTDPERIADLWENRKYNIGIFTGKYKDGALIAIDVDNKNGKSGDDTLRSLKDAGKGLQKTYLQTTPTGGKHIVYKAKTSVKNSVCKLGKDLDIRSKGGYIVGSGSLIDGNFYMDNGVFEIADCPAWVLDGCEAPLERKHNVTAINANIDLNQDNLIEKCKQYLLKAPAAIENEGGDQATYQVACVLRDKGLTLETAIHLMSEVYNQRCIPPWPEDELRIKVENAFTYAINSPGVSAPERQFDALPPQEGEHYLDKINQEYAMLFGAGQHHILRESLDVKGQKSFVIMQEAAFKAQLAHLTVTIEQKEKKNKVSSQADLWLKWKDRRRYDGICFLPGKEAPKKFYNTWQGFAVEPVAYETASNDAKKGLDMLLDHARENICDGNPEHFNWIMGYFAHMIQRPYEKPRTTVVFKGEKGVGKNAFINMVGGLLGARHHVVASSSRYLTSNFNSHMDSCISLVLDEAFWSGDKAADGVLKGLTTEATLIIEPKRKDSYQIDNFMRITIIGNEDWLVPATVDERRYAVFNIGNLRKQDRKYFSQMVRCMEKLGGNAVFLDYLQKFDLDLVDVDAAPHTKALAEQKINSFNAVQTFWYECLGEGRIVFSDFNEEWETSVDASRLRDAFLRFKKESNIHSRYDTPTKIGRAFKKHIPGIEKHRVRRGKSLAYDYEFPPLEKAREIWDNHVGFPTDWE